MQMNHNLDRNNESVWLFDDTSKNASSLANSVDPEHSI